MKENFHMIRRAVEIQAKTMVASSRLAPKYLASDLLLLIPVIEVPYFCTQFHFSRSLGGHVLGTGSKRKLMSGTVQPHEKEHVSVTPTVARVLE
jgi:hypothetical protein